MNIESLTQLFAGFVPDLIYDLIKFIVGYIIARLIYEGMFKKWRYGDWTLVVKRDGRELTRRTLSPQLAESVIKNDNDLSVYVKGVVSFHDWLRMDICSPEAHDCGLLRWDDKTSTITVDLDKNPPAPPNPNRSNGDPTGPSAPTAEA